MKYIIWIIVIALVIWGLVAWGGDKTPVAEGAPIKIGAILSETGVAASFGEMSRKGIELAVKEINNNNGVDGRMVSVVFEDDRTDPKAAAGAYQKLTSVDGVEAIIGSNFDFVTQPIFSFAQNGNTVVVSPSNPRIPGAFDTNTQSFVMMSDFNKIINVFKDYLQTISYNQLGILRFESSFGEEIQKTLNTIQAELNKKPIIAETYKEIGNNDFRTQILKLKQSGVDLIFLDMVAIDPVTFITQAKQLGYNPKIITHIGLQDALSMSDINPDMFNGIVLVNWNVSPEAFIEKFESAYGIKPDKSANRAYDAVYLLAEAVAKAEDKSEVYRLLETETFSTPNGNFKFSSEHAAELTPVILQIVEAGKLIELN